MLRESKVPQYGVLQSGDLPRKSRAQHHHRADLVRSSITFGQRMQRASFQRVECCQRYPKRGQSRRGRLLLLLLISQYNRIELLFQILDESDSAHIPPLCEIR